MKTALITIIDKVGNVKTWTFDPSKRMHLELLAAELAAVTTHGITINIQPSPQ